MTSSLYKAIPYNQYKFQMPGVYQQKVYKSYLIGSQLT